MNRQHSILMLQILQATKRPMFFNIINNPKCDRPRITIKRDPLFKGPEFDHDVIVALSDLPEELQKRNKLAKLSEVLPFLFSAADDRNLT